VAFRARAETGGILVTWETSFESDHLGFRLHRGRRREDAGRAISGLIGPPGPYIFLDAEPTPGIAYFYRLEAVDRDGMSRLFGPVTATAEAPRASFALAQNRPNPFVAARGATVIPFVLAAPAPAKLSVFDTAGRLVRVLVDAPLARGAHAARWDGRDAAGAEIGSGIFYYRLEAGAFSATRALVKIQ
jgi:hypothetical protein